jgi:hypothetical protein
MKVLGVNWNPHVLSGMYFFFIGYLTNFLMQSLYTAGWWRDWWIGKDLEEGGCSLIEVFLRICRGGGLNNSTKTFSQDNRFLGQDSNRTPSEHKSAAWPLESKRYTSLESRLSFPVSSIRKGSNLLYVWNLKFSWRSSLALLYFWKWHHVVW